MFGSEANNNNINESAFRSYESYILEDKNIEEGLRNLVVGSEAYNYLRCIDLLTKKKLSLSKEEENFIEKYCKNNYTNEAKKIKLRWNMLKYDVAQSTEEKSKLLEEFNSKCMSLSFGSLNTTQNVFKRPDEVSKTIEVNNQNANLFDRLDLRKEFELLYENKLRVEDFSKSALVKLDFDRLNWPTFISVLNYMGSNIAMLKNNKNFWDVVSYKYRMVFDNTPNTNYQIGVGVFQGMTIEQMDELAKRIPEAKNTENFRESYFTKKFNKELSEEENSYLSPEEVRNNLILMYKYLKIIPDYKMCERNSILKRILKNGLKVNIYDDDYFMDYIQSILNNQFCVPKKSVFEFTNSKVFDQAERLIDLNKIPIEDKELIRKYLEHFFLQGHTLERYCKFIKNYSLVEVYDDLMLMAGKKVHFSLANNKRLEKLTTSVSITISELNKDVFAIGEEVSLYIELKNVSKLFVKVFEINTENYYRKKMELFKTDINLDGLVASIERIIENNNPPYVKYQEKLEFPELKGRVGLYVVELIGNGKSSRAVLKIGTLSLITRPTVAGQVCYILDGERKICCDESTSIWMAEQYFKADMKNGGRIIIPYLPSGGKKTEKVILLHKGVAQLDKIERMEEIYTMTCNFYLFPETIIMGKNCTILVRPQLFINGKLASVKLLKNIKCTINTSNYIDNIPSTKTISNLKVSESEELVIKFRVGANLSELQTTLSAEVQNITKGIHQVLTNTHVFSISNHSNDYSIAEFYLKLNSDNDYELHVLGKNGEPIANSKVYVTLNVKMIEYSKNLTGTTNKDGIIKLGKLEGVKKITAMLKQLGNERLSRTWILPSRVMMQYPEVIDIIEDETIELPISRECESESLFLHNVFNFNNISDYSDSIKISSDENLLYSTATISGLKSGTYYLSGIEDKVITIRVHKGTYWSEDSSYILKKYSLLEQSKKQGFIKIKSVSFEEGKSQLKVEVEGATKDKWRVHVLLFRYLPADLDKLTMKLLVKEQFYGHEYFFQKWKNFYLSNRELADEFNYCFERLQQPQYTGNMLDKPKLLLKRALLRPTNLEKEKLAQGTAHAVKVEQQPQTQSAHPQPNTCKSESQFHTNNPSIQSQKNIICLYQNFLQQEPIMRYNIPATYDGSLILKLNEEFQKNYGCALVVAVDQGSVAHYICPLSGSEIKQRNLSLVKALDKEKSYSEMRTAKCISKYETYRIDDMTNTELKMIDSLQKVYFVIRELMQLNSIYVKDLDKFEQLLLWNTLKEEDKNKILSKYTSHELHLFIYKKDPEYFNKVVKDYLQNKMEKTFVDYYLLGNIEKVLEYSVPYLFVKLNAFEKALLVEVAAQNGKSELAKTIVELFKNILKPHAISARVYNRIFDTVLSLGALKTSQVGVQRIIEEEKTAIVESRPTSTGISSYLQQNQPSSTLFGQTNNASSSIIQPPTGSGFVVPSQSMFMNTDMIQSTPLGSQTRPETNLFSSGTILSGNTRTNGLFVSEVPPLPSNSFYSTQSNQISQMNNVPVQQNNNIFNDPFSSNDLQRPYVLTELSETKEYTETNYYGLKTNQNFSDHVKISEFWIEYAKYFAEAKDGKPNKPFLTHQFITSYHNLTEIIGVLSLLDLPYTSLDHGFKTIEGRSAELKAASNLIIFQKEIKESKKELRNNIVVTQRYEDLEQPSIKEKHIEEFLVNNIYTGRVIITNVSHDLLELDVLIQIPQGALPIGPSPYQKSYSVSLGSFFSYKLEYAFYFPETGSFPHFPPNVSINSVVVAKANTETLNVLKEKTKISTTNFRDVLLTGNQDLILNFMKENPIGSVEGFELKDIYWLLKDYKFFEQLIAILRKQQYFDFIVWSYGLYHSKAIIDNKCEDVIAEYFNYSDLVKKSLGYYFDSKLVKVRPIDSGLRHLDYYPLTNPRAHKNLIKGVSENNSDQPMIPNKQLYDTYKRFIIYLIEKPVWDLADKMSLTYYLLLQDRISKALKVFSKIDAKTEIEKEKRLKLQYDYMTAYLDFYVGSPEFKTARKIVANYLNYPVISWRLLFLDMDQQLKEYDGIDTEEETKEIIKKNQITSEPQLNITLKEKTLLVEYNNITEITIKYYIINLETLFSRTPFLTQNIEDFSYVKPNSSESIQLNPKMKEHSIEIPEKYTKQNVLIEVNTGAIQRLVTYFSTSLKLQVYEKYGELKVMDETGKKLSQVYVKAFVMKKDGSVAFHKDGYTDIRGRFDYILVSASELVNVKRFALFVIKDKYGSLIRECSPPPIIHHEEDVEPVKSRLTSYYDKQQAMMNNKF